MRLNYQYRIYPYTQQMEQLNEWLRICRYLYNRWLGQCLDWWDTHRCSVNACPLVCQLPELTENPYFMDLKSQLPGLKSDLVMVQWSGELLDLKSVYSTVLQDVYTSRLKKAMDRYIAGDGNGKRSGRPRFKTGADYHSFKFPQVKQEWFDRKNAVLHLPFIGGVQIRLHRPLPDGFTLKTIQVIKKADGWYFSAIRLAQMSINTQGRLASCLVTFGLSSHLNPKRDDNLISMWVRTPNRANMRRQLGE